MSRKYTEREDSFSLRHELEKFLKGLGPYRILSLTSVRLFFEEPRKNEIPIEYFTVIPGFESSNCIKSLCEKMGAEMVENPENGDSEFLFNGEKYRVYMHPEKNHTAFEVARVDTFTYKQ